MNYLVVLGSPNSKGFGNWIIKNIDENMFNTDQNIKFQILRMSDTNYSLCSGCSRCFVDGKCELTQNDNYDFLDILKKYKGLIFLVPSYIHQMPAILKNCFDRMASSMHEFPFIGKKVLLVTYSKSNGEMELANYFRGIMNSLGCEVVEAIAFNRFRDNEDNLLKEIKKSILIMEEKIVNRKFIVTRSQEQLFTYIKQIINIEKEQNIKSYKQRKWDELLRYDSLQEYLKNTNFE